MTASVCIPFRCSPSRIKPYERVRRFWDEHCPDWPVIVADSDTEIFSLSQARNNAVAQARTDIVVLCDADTIPPIHSVHVAVADPEGIQWPHKIWRSIPAHWCDQPDKELRNAPVLMEYPNGLGGVMVCTTREFWRLGGYPPEFEGWGSEDRAFHIIAGTLSSFRRIGGTAYSFEHNGEYYGEADTPGWTRDDQRNKELIKQYQRAAGRPWLMRAVIAARDAELAAP